jgi:hypothetical protein
MSWRTREAGHIVLNETDFAPLSELPLDVGFQVYTRVFKRRTSWLIGTGCISAGKKWDPGGHPFAQAAPCGSKQFVQMAKKHVRPFYDVIGKVDSRTQSTAVNYFTMKPVAHKTAGSKIELGELSLGLQLATLLGVPVCSFLSDPDDDRELICLSEPASITRVVCRRAGLVLEFTKGILSVSPKCPESLAKIPGVRSARPIRRYPYPYHSMVVAEINMYAGKKYADPDQVLPDVKNLGLIGERRTGGAYRSRV